MTLLEIPAYIAIGALAGVLAGLLGVGGGAVIVPALIVVFAEAQLSGDWIPHLAVGTSLTTIIGTGAASTLAHQRRGSVRWDIVLKMAPGIVAGAWLGAAIVSYIPDLWLKRLFAVFLGTLGIKMLLSGQPAGARGAALPGSMKLTATGGGIGLLSALVGIGGGTMTVPFLSSHGIDMRQAVGTSAACGLPIAVAGAIGFAIAGWGQLDLPPLSSGFIYWPAVVIILIASIPAAPLGARLAHSLPITILKRTFGVLLILVAAHLGLS
ncbi:sulfite exporter TauE/SafE family protein [Thiorhodococcus minor]|uniref:Probable membrane transporter protein n=1 Tax=Thiorhodococcus minor TaxID=57489 RepID=A0A6M0JU53_9GAMM|nr:sulfite exporter TauE/SafE family protein [Thiorhodococcus minor]NEV60709.1 sulfite exporter TauE/SafE family protein [Thiorhodococcus minor]